ncbi:uncharacterized protein LOC143038144 isoform X2 [Oratosquilla oratoria]|uniref:uncharacterized protein LOC143038144 isoform X2 n=1 Tax=Oratosquilla oratoria TaxID=337810 RepID=UPI003F765872
MDDDMENEIIYELFTAHIHIIWRFIGLTGAGIADTVMPGPGESFRSKLLQPWPCMFIVFLCIVASVVIQNSSDLIKRFGYKARHTFGLSQVRLSEHNLKTIVNSTLSNDNITWNLTEGIVGVYSLQGRRGNMEDRFCVKQNIDVGDNRKISFFGVYDGHGGQFAAEYVKENLYKSTLEKIQELRQGNNKGSGEECKEREPSKSKESILANSLNGSNGFCNLNRRSSKKSEENECVEPPLEATKVEESRGEQGPAQRRKISTGSIASSSSTGNATRPMMNGEVVAGRGSGVQDMTSSSPLSATLSSTSSSSSSQSSPSPTISDETSLNKSNKDQESLLKKDDAYTTISKKRNSITNINNNNINSNNNNKKDEDGISTSSYLDSYRNINYTRLLTDQINTVDSELVQYCKSRVDMSGTTAVVAILDGELLIIGNVGDSRAVMGDLRGSTIPLSFDHKPNQLKERRRIKEAGGFITFTGVWRVAGILATSRALGDFPLKDPRKLVTPEPDVLTFSLRDHKAL